MPRYISEYKITVEGGRITIPTCARLIAIEKVSNYFVLIAEIWGNPELLYDIDVRVFHKDEYILPDAKYLGYTIVGTEIFHFNYTTYVEDKIDLGGDGGIPPDASVEPEKPKPKTNVGLKSAGGLKEW